MLQIDIAPYASDALEDAMRLAQTKSLNSYTFSDCLSFLNYVWSDIYSQICMVDSGYYSRTVRLKDKLTKLPKFVKNSISVYAAQSQTDCNRLIYRQSGDSDMLSSFTYRISGNDLYCPDATRRTVFLEYCPQPQQIFFTHHNRDPKIYTDGMSEVYCSDYKVYMLRGRYATNDDTVTIDPAKNPSDISKCTEWVLVHKSMNAELDIEITDRLLIDADDDGRWELKYVSCDFPYIFVSYQHSVTSEWKSGFLDRNFDFTLFNPFDFTGRNNNVEYVKVSWNDKTGMGAVVRDWNDLNETLLNIDKLPQKTGTIIFVENDFEYRASDEVAYKYRTGYYLSRFATDYNYERIPSIKSDIDVATYMIAPDTGDVIMWLMGSIDGYNNGNMYKYDGEKWNTVDMDSVIHVAQRHTEPKYKELGWTPDTRLMYPAPEVYRYLVARLAEKFALLNESSLMAVQSELVDARFAFQAFLKKDKSAWERMRNVNPATLGDYL